MIVLIIALISLLVYFKFYTLGYKKKDILFFVISFDILALLLYFFKY